MESEKENKGKTGGCTYHWKIENINHFYCWWLRVADEIQSPTFAADTLQRTKWFLLAFKDEDFLLLYLQREKDCCGPDSIEVFYEFAILGKDGSILKTGGKKKYKFEKGDCCDSYYELERERIFGPERESFILEGALNVQCKIWMEDVEPTKSNHLFDISIMQMKWRSFECRIDKKSTLKSGIRNNFKDNLLSFDVNLSEAIDKLDVNITSINESVRFIMCIPWILDLDYSGENYQIKKYFADDIGEVPLSFIITLPEKEMDNKSRYCKDDVLSIHFEFSLGIVEHYSDRCKNSARLENHVCTKENTQNAKGLVHDLKSLYNDGIFSDMELRTSSKSFPAHKIILSARSPVFRRMLGTDMKEKNSGHVDIADFDADTVQRMLLFLYTDALEDLQFESACRLYEIADKYEILSLKSRCSSFLLENLCPTNACKVLVLAFLHNDEELNCVVQDYVLRKHKQIFRSQEWKEFMGTHLQLAADIMLKKYNESE